MKKTGRIALLALGIMAALLLLAMPAFADSYTSRVTSFINDSRWCNGTWWGNGKRPEVSTYDCSTCFAYAADFSKQVWASHPNWFGVNGVYFTDISQVRDGDVIHISNHYYVVLQRTGNTLWTAEGNCDQHVRISKTVYNASSASALGGFINGWHNPDYEPYGVNQDPTGVFDELWSGKGYIHVRGWAYDPDTLGQSLQIHVYVGAPAGSGVPSKHITANISRPDIGGNYGYDADIPVDVTGTQEVYVYAINSGGGNNPLLGHKSVTIPADTEVPVISNIRITDVSSSGYTVSCDVSDDGEIAKVAFPTWTLANDQDDIIANWENNALGTISGGHVTYRVNTAVHGNQTGCVYRTHIYAYDKAGKSIHANQRSFPWLDVNVPAPGEQPTLTPAPTQLEQPKLISFKQNGCELSLTWKPVPLFSTNDRRTYTVDIRQYSAPETDYVLHQEGITDCALTAVASGLIPGQPYKIRIHSVNANTGESSKRGQYDVDVLRVFMADGEFEMPVQIYLEVGEELHPIEWAMLADKTMGMAYGEGQIKWSVGPTSAETVGVEYDAASGVDWSHEKLVAKKLGSVLMVIAFVDEPRTSRDIVVTTWQSEPVKLPDGLKRIESEAFAGASFESVVIPEGCTSIGSRAFANCKQLKKLVIPASVTQIAADCLDGTGPMAIFCAADSPAVNIARSRRAYGVWYRTMD